MTNINLKPLIILLFSIFCLIPFAKSQKSDFTLGIVMPNSSSDFSQEQIQKLESKIIQIINNSNDVMVGYSNDFIVYPIVSIEETNIVEGGLQNLTVTSIDLSLFVKQVSTNVVYNSISKRIKGSGNNKSQSITNAFSQIKTNEESYKQFLSTSKTKITKYYTDNCKKIIQNAENLATKQDYEQSLGILQSIPNSIENCYNEAQSKSIEIYKKYQSILCSKNLTKAKAAIAINDFPNALETLEQIDPSSSCYNEVKKLITQISQKVDRKEKQELDLEKQRINAIKEIGKAYYSNTIRLIKYNVIVR